MLLLLNRIILPIVLVLNFACTGIAGHRQGPLLAPYYHSHRQLQEVQTNATTPLEFCNADCACASEDKQEEEECKQYDMEYQATCTCREQLDGTVVQTDMDGCLTCVNGTDLCYSFTVTSIASADDGTPDWIGFHQACYVLKDNKVCLSTTSGLDAPSPAPCTVHYNEVECNSCVDVFSDNPAGMEINCTNIEEGTFAYISEEGEPIGWVGVLEDAGIALFAGNEYPMCPDDANPNVQTNARTPLELCNASCACASEDKQEEEKCKQYLIDYQATCTCTEQLDGTVLQTFVDGCLTCVNGTDLCYSFNVTDTAIASGDDGTPDWIGFYQECAVHKGDEFCVSTPAGWNAPSPAPCTVLYNGVECNSCVDVFSDNPAAMEINCTNIEEGELIRWLGIFAHNETEYPMCPDDNSSGARSLFGCAVMSAMGVAATVFM